MDFNDEFDRISKLMRNDFDRAKHMSSHPGLKGDSAESIVRSFLCDYLPKNLEVSTGQIFDTNKNISNQLDIIIHDRDHTPILYLDREKKTKLIPVECVYSVIEVKSYLGKRELLKKGSGIFDNMLSVRKLEKKAFYASGMITHDTTNYGREWTDWPVNYFVFAFGSTSLKTIYEHINKYHIDNELPPEKRIDAVCVLGEGLIINQLESDQYSACPDGLSELVYIKTPQEILFFYTLVTHFLLQVKMRQFKFMDYMGTIPFTETNSRTS